jgi:hypothetical protein
MKLQREALQLYRSNLFYKNLFEQDHELRACKPWLALSEQDHRTVFIHYVIKLLC